LRRVSIALQTGAAGSPRIQSRSALQLDADILAQLSRLRHYSYVSTLTGTIGGREPKAIMTLVQVSPISYPLISLLSLSHLKRIG
jgi:hypothetical protein